MPSDHLLFDVHIPKSLAVISETDVRGCCNTVCQYEGYTYVGMSGGSIHRIDTHGVLTENFRDMKLSKLLAVCPLDGKVYASGRSGAKYKVFVHELAHQGTIWWDYHDSNTDASSGRNMCVINNKLAVLDRKNQRIALYTPTGKTIKHLPCLSIPKDSRTALCYGGDDSIIVTDENNSKVFRLNLTSEVVEWESPHVSMPQCATLYGTDNLLVANRGAKMKIWILDVKSGTCMADLS